MNKSPGAEEKFKEISAAYEVLSDDEKRSVYDRFGESGLLSEFGGPGANSQGMDPFDIFDAYFEESNGFFGGGEFRNNRNQTLDIRYDLSLSFEESIFGCRREIDVSYLEMCDKCDGTGARSSSCIKSCTDCGGRGRMINTQKTPFGVMSQVSTCFKCGGEGKKITDHCPRCSGRGKVQAKRSIKVIVPPGINDGATMKIQGEGNFDKKRSIAGDLYLFVQIEEKPGIWREGLSLYSKIAVDYTDAILGTVVKVETVEGFRDLRISPGIQPGETVKLPGMGVPSMKKPSVRGDHKFIINVEIPTDISEEERALLEKLASLKTSRRTHSIPTSGSHNLDQREMNSNQTRPSSKGSRLISSILGSISNLWRQKESGGRFASVSAAAVATPMQAFSRPNDPLIISAYMAFLVLCICSLKGMIDSRSSLQQRKHCNATKAKRQC
ncbi:hypothetical protein Syun_021934 [Stephania yunnanensis]|uniref:Chaperone protein DnaJ n=1 Tax=Stephania yunnanensis TaxID=152371 RepID=A0AAP0IGW7_9MAGN